MRLVDQEPRIVAALDLDQICRIRDVAVHAIEPLDDDQGPAIARPIEPQCAFEGVEVVVRTIAVLHVIPVATSSC